MTIADLETQYALVANGEFVQSPAGHAYINE